MAWVWQGPLRCCLQKQRQEPNEATKASPWIQKSCFQTLKTTKESSFTRTPGYKESSRGGCKRQRSKRMLQKCLDKLMRADSIPQGHSREGQPFIGPKNRGVYRVYPPWVTLQGNVYVVWERLTPFNQSHQNLPAHNLLLRLFEHLWELEDISPWALDVAQPIPHIKRKGAFVFIVDLDGHLLLGFLIFC